MENISGVAASQRINQYCFTGCSHAGLQEFTHVIDSFGCWRIYQQSGAEFAPSLPAPTRDRALLLYPQGALCSDAQHGKDLSRKWQTVFVSMKATPWARQRALRGRQALAGW